MRNKAIGSLAVFSILAVNFLWSPDARAGVEECVQTAGGGDVTCTAPIVPAEFSYGACVANLLTTTVNAEGFCDQKLGPIKNDAGIVEFVNCVGERLGATNLMSSVNWKPPGYTDNTASNLCWPIKVVAKNGLELHGYDIQQLYYWIVARRDRVPVCPYGWATVNDADNIPDYCKKPVCDVCDTVGNPMQVATGQKFLRETDYAQQGASMLEFSRSYGSYAFYRSPQQNMQQRAGFGDFWRHSYSGFVIPENGARLMATLILPGPVERHIGIDGKEALNPARSRSLLSQSAGGWIHQAPSNRLESFDSEGKLLAIHEAQGRSVNMTYSDANTPVNVAKRPGLLIQATDNFGRELKFTYNERDQMASMTDPGGGVYQYTFDSNQMLTKVAHPDATQRGFAYNSTPDFASKGGPYALSFVYDEAGVQYAKYTYGDGYWNTAFSTEHAGGVQRYQRSAWSIPTTDPLNTTRSYSTATVKGVTRVTGASKVGDSSVDTYSSIQLDASGNKTSSTDFRGGVTCHTNDEDRRLELVRVEGLTNNNQCASALAAAASLPGDARKTTTQWHPVWQLQTRVAQALNTVTYVYNGQADPTGGTANCAGGAGLLPNGQPIAVLCKKIEQDTTDPTGAQGFAATETGAPRVWTYTYNQWGQRLTETGPGNETTTSSYYASTTSTHTLGDLQSVTDAAGKTTTYDTYDRNGRVLSQTSPEGIVTASTYDLRGRLLTQTVGGLTTIMTYLPTGLLASVTQPNGYKTTYTYDPAHRLTGWSDNRGSSGTYVLDGMGNRTSEQTKDSTGAIAFQLSRTINDINRVSGETVGGNQSVSYQYDANGDLIGHTNALNQNTTLTLDGLRRVTKERSPINADATLGYNSLDAVTQATDFIGVTTTYTRDAQGNAPSEASPDIGTTTNTFDPRGLPSTSQDAAGRTQSITRDALGRPTTIDRGAGATSTLTYE